LPLNRRNAQAQFRNLEPPHSEYRTTEHRIPPSNIAAPEGQESLAGGRRPPGQRRLSDAEGVAERPGVRQRNVQTMNTMVDNSSSRALKNIARMPRSTPRRISNHLHKLHEEKSSLKVVIRQPSQEKFPKFPTHKNTGNFGNFVGLNRRTLSRRDVDRDEATPFQPNHDGVKHSLDPRPEGATESNRYRSPRRKGAAPEGQPSLAGGRRPPVIKRPPDAEGVAERPAKSSKSLPVHNLPLREL
jgi:hypothetical protein